ncbi:MAG TPA: riboflavin synthase [Mycobacteriales bacterium]|jgi:riboflavin synthase|nr:riboflavin synthase [Mycobacteriales bacterium]
MFTGIVEDLGTVEAVEPLDAAARLSIIGSTLDDVRPGDSIAVNGVCLTAAEVRAGAFTADVMAETLRRSTLGELRAGAKVNLERAVTPTTRLGGHLVQGHVDGVGTVLARRPSAHWDEVDLELPADLAKYVVEKGSICLDGISLTVASLGDARITVSLIPETLARTTLGSRTVGDHVNVEVDVLAKYVERLLAARSSDGSRG